MNPYSNRKIPIRIKANTFKVILLCITPIFLFVNNKNAQTPKPTNVLLICIDDLRPSLGVYGDEFAISPNIDKLASDSYIFKQAFAQQSVCNPSRASMLTGLRPSTTKIYDLETHIRDNLPDVTTLPQLFKQNGFHSIGLGKIFHNYLDDPISWSEPLFYLKNLPKWRLDENIELARTVGNGPSTEFTSGFEGTYRDALMTNEAIERIRNHGGKSFFMAVGYIRPHLPFVASNKFLELYENHNVPNISMDNFPLLSPMIAHMNYEELRNYSDIPKKGDINTETKTRLIKGYYACVTFIDSLIGNLIDELKKQNLYDNTLIILWGDHGFKLGEFGAWSKHTNYDIDTRVPLIIKDITNRHEVREEIVEAIDIYKTLAEYFNFIPVQKLEGDNLFHQPPPDSVEYAISFTQRPNNQIGISIRTDRFRYVLWSKNEQELYDHYYWGESVNVSSNKKYRDVTQYFKDFLKSKRFETNDFINKQIEASPMFLATHLDEVKKVLKYG